MEEGREGGRRVGRRRERGYIQLTFLGPDRVFGRHHQTWWKRESLEEMIWDREGEGIVGRIGMKVSALVPSLSPWLPNFSR